MKLSGFFMLPYLFLTGFDWRWRWFSWSWCWLNWRWCWFLDCHGCALLIANVLQKVCKSIKTFVFGSFYPKKTLEMVHFYQKNRLLFKLN